MARKRTLPKNRMVYDVSALPTLVGAVKPEQDNLRRGQLLRVDCDDGFQFIPCFPKPGVKNTLTRVENGTWVVYLGTVEFAGTTCMEFMIENTETYFYLGDGVLPYLINVPKRQTRKAAPKVAKKKGSPTGTKDGVRWKPAGNHKRPSEGLVNLSTGQVSLTKPSRPRRKRRRLRTI